MVDISAQWQDGGRSATGPDRDQGQGLRCWRFAHSCKKRCSTILDVFTSGSRVVETQQQAEWNSQHQRCWGQLPPCCWRSTQQWEDTRRHMHTRGDSHPTGYTWTKNKKKKKDIKGEKRGEMIRNRPHPSFSCWVVGFNFGTVESSPFLVAYTIAAQRGKENQ